MRHPANIYPIFRAVVLSVSILVLSSCASALKSTSSNMAFEQSEPVQQGPYTVSLLADGVYHIEDSNDSNPAGMHEGGMNNCSDMYLVVGRDKALLIDLSNAIRWDDSANESLRLIVSERIGDTEFYITVTHNHGDHLGMLPAFIDDPSAEFRVSGPEFNTERGHRFPAERTTYFDENASFDLGGGFVINTMEVPGHTAHSTLFFLKGQNLVFTGDAIGSGSGVWLFNEESFYTYSNAIENLILYIEDPANNIDLDQLVIHGGHAWQKGQLEKLTAQYIYDMRTLIEKMGQGAEVETTGASSSMPFLDTNFKYGTATITWNREAAERYAGSLAD